MRRILISIAVLAVPLPLIAGPAVQAASAQVVSTAASGSGSSRATVTVPATQPWTNTGIAPSAGTVSFTASGTINVQSGNPAFNNTPAGQGPADPGCIGNSNTPWGDDWTAEGLPCWSLIGRIGDGSPFEIGDAATFTVSSPGELYLGVNDQADAFGDNSGSWTVLVTISANQPPPSLQAQAIKDLMGPRCPLATTCAGYWVSGRQGAHSSPKQMAARRSKEIR